VNAGDVITGPDGRTYLVLGARPGSSGWVIDVEPVKTFDVLLALERMQAPPPLLAWLRQRPALSWQEAWNTCERGDLLAWLVARLAGDLGSPAHRRLVGCLVDVAYALAWPWLHDHDALAESARRCLALAAVDFDARADAAAHSEALRCAAEIVRAHYPTAPEIGGAP